MRPTLSLLIPAYNAAQFLPRLLKSAHAQTEAFDEIWVYDDSSTDDTSAVAAAYGAGVVRGEVNKGCSAGKNVLARRTKCDWVHFHDADDELLPNFVESARRWMEQDEHDVVLFNYEFRDYITGELLDVSSFDDLSLRCDARKYAITTQINPFCGLYRRSTLLEAGGYDEDPRVLYNEDVAFHIKLAFHGLKFAADPKTTVINYRIGSSMSAANRKKCLLAQMEVMRSTIKLDLDKLYSQQIGHKLWHISSVMASDRMWREAAAAVRLASQLCPPPLQSGRMLFNFVARLSPILALFGREIAIRSFKPYLRRGDAR